DELPLALVDVLLDLLADLVLDGDLGEGLLGPGEDLLEALLDVEGLEDLDLLLQTEVGRVPGHVGEGARLGDAPEDLGDLRDAAGLDDVLDGAPVLAGELAGALGHGIGLVGLLDLDPGGIPGPGDAGPDDGPVEPPDDEGLHAVLEG